MNSKKPLDLRDRWVLVTGASSGLGRAMARVLAREHGAHLVLTARNHERLEALAAELRGHAGVEVAVVTADLSRPDEVDRLFEAATTDRTLHAVVLNAGVTWYGRHVDMPWTAFETLLATNVTSVVRLAGLFVPYLAGHSPGSGLLIVSSLGGYVPMPYQAAYGASKAFLNHFGLDLREEIRDRDVSLTVFAPGGIATDMVKKAGLDERYDESSPWLMPVERCARAGVQALIRRRALVVPGFLNKLGAFLHRALPRGVMMRALARAYRPDPSPPTGP